MRIARRPLEPSAGELVAERFLVKSQIGAGGMGRVYAAIDLESGQDVALKVLAPVAFTAGNVRRFWREAEASISLKHRHICDVRHMGLEHGAPFMVMERLSGETVARRLKQTGALSVADAITITLQVLEGLSAAHAVGVIHRDIKPGNMLLTTERGKAPFVKIFDFGVAKLLPTFNLARQIREESFVTHCDVIPGTPSYMSPEQLSGCRDLDGRVDIWAAGLSLYEMIVGRRVYEADTQVALVGRILLEPVPPLCLVRPDLPPALDDVLAKALAKDRERRYPSAASFRAALVEAWARHRAAGVIRGALVRDAEPETPPTPRMFHRTAIRG